MEDGKLYQRKTEADLKEDLFLNPTAEYRGSPFWAWNCKLKEDMLLKEIGQLKEMGMGGFHIHCRVGLDTRYLGEDYFVKVKKCIEEAKRLEMLCYLYDEDRWPSGSAGGFVTKDVQYRARFLVFMPEDTPEQKDGVYMAAAKAVRSNNRILLGKYRICLDKDGYMTSYEMQDAKASGKSDLWCAYLEVSGDTPWFNNQAYVNTLDKKAINQFICKTHEKYYGELKEDFGGIIPSIFTDEPQISHKEMLCNPFSLEPVLLPFTDDFEETFQTKYGVSLIEHLPELIWEQKHKPVSQIRYYYHAHVNERFSEAFGDNVGRWCEEHKIALTGHMMNEWTLHSQTMASGEVMRPMKNFGIPGIDMLCDRREYSTVKQAQSIAHQNNREGVMSELYGVTGWDFDFRNHKLAGDWQAALGVTLRVPHLTWVSMEGEAKRDYPASIGYQSPWYKEYSYIEDHFARLNTALTRGRAHVRVGVIHPVESYWMYWGNQEQTSLLRQVLESNFEMLIEWLLFGLIDFDFISEAVLEDEMGNGKDDSFHMGEMLYDVVIVPECHTLRSHTLMQLNAFAGAGGEVIFMGEIPRYIDGVESKKPEEVAKQCKHISFNRTRLLETMEKHREVDISVSNINAESNSIAHKECGTRSCNLFYQMRDDKKAKWLFIAHVNKPNNENITYTEEWTIRIKGIYFPEVYDTMTGEIYPVEAEHKNGKTCVKHYASQHDSLLLRLNDNEVEIGRKKRKPTYVVAEKSAYLPQPSGYETEEENVMLLDMAEYSFDDGSIQAEEELLRIDNLFRTKLGLPLRMEALAQPWIYEEAEVTSHSLHLYFSIESEIETEGILLALENPKTVQISWNGEAVTKKDEGWYVDESIRKIRLPALLKGVNKLHLILPFGRRTNTEWLYLLGDFGVQVSGRKKLITHKPQNILYGDFTKQGLPFYAGNFVYDVMIECKKGHLYMEFSHYKGALIQIELDGEKKGNVALAPYQIDCGNMTEGKHSLKIKLFGNRHNAFGPIHNADASECWYGPNLWRTKGNKWSYEYQLKEMGILTTPTYWVCET